MSFFARFRRNFYETSSICMDFPHRFSPIATILIWEPSALLKAFFAFMSVCDIFYSCIHCPLQIPFYPYAINIILDDDPDINDQELDGQQQVHSSSGFAILLFPVVLSLSVFSPLGLGFGGERCRDFVRPRSFSFYNYKQGS